MGRILVGGLSPAWQQILCFDRLLAGEVNRATQVHGCASGKVLNVARACAALGAPTSVVTAIGGLTGQAICEEFAPLGMETRWVDTGTNTRTCTTLLDAAKHTTTELVENAAALSASQLEEFRSSFHELAKDAAVVVFTGSLPAGTGPEFVADLLAPLSVPLILDIRGPELLACLPLRPLLVKPNREELAKTYPAKSEIEQNLATAMRDVIAGGARSVAVSNGANGLSLLISGEDHRLEPPRVETVNPIGCGDCLAAGIAVGVLSGLDVVEAVRLGMGAAAQNASMLLPARIDFGTARRLADQVRPAAIQPDPAAGDRGNP